MEMLEDKCEIQSLNKQDQNIYDLIDLLKFVGSIMVFTMHINAFCDFQNIGLLFETATRWCVPFFFITSSYFLFSKSNGNNITFQSLKNYIKRIGLLYCVYFSYLYLNTHVTLN